MIRFRPRRGAPTETGRLEAFSDGVFAVAITLLALDLARIHAAPSESPPVTLFESLATQWPTLLAFGGAFAFVGVAWTNHHNVFVRVRAASRSLNGANLVLLAGIVVVPWATSNLAEALGLPGADAGRQAIVVYAAVTIVGAVSWGLLFHVLASNPDLLEDPSHAHGFATDRAGSIIGIATTAGAAAVGWFASPTLGTALLALVPVVFAVASEGFERTPREPAIGMNATAGPQASSRHEVGPPMKQDVVRAGEGPDYDWSQDHVTVKTPLELTAGRVTVVEDTLKPGFHLARHYHRSMVEIFYILDGVVTFAFDDAVVVATPGMTLNVLPEVRHEVTCEAGGKLLTVFTPGGFDRYLAELAGLSEAQLADVDFIVALGNRYDTWADPHPTVLQADPKPALGSAETGRLVSPSCGGDA